MSVQSFQTVGHLISGNIVNFLPSFRILVILKIQKKPLKLIHLDIRTQKFLVTRCSISSINTSTENVTPVKKDSVGRYVIFSPETACSVRNLQKRAKNNDSSHTSNWDSSVFPGQTIFMEFSIASNQFVANHSNLKLKKECFASKFWWSEDCEKRLFYSSRYSNSWFSVTTVWIFSIMVSIKNLILVIEIWLKNNEFVVCIEMMWHRELEIVPINFPNFILGHLSLVTIGLTFPIIRSIAGLKHNVAYVT